MYTGEDIARETCSIVLKELRLKYPSTYWDCDIALLLIYPGGFADEEDVALN